MIPPPTLPSDSSENTDPVFLELSDGPPPRWTHDHESHSTSMISRRPANKFREWLRVIKRIPPDFQVSSSDFLLISTPFSSSALSSTSSISLSQTYSIHRQTWSWLLDGRGY